MSTEIIRVETSPALAHAKTLADAFDAWLAELDLAGDTQAAYRVSVERWFDWRAENGFTGMAPTAQEIKAFRDSHTSASTANLRLSAVRSFLQWSHEYGFIDDNPAHGVKGKKRSGTSTTHKKDRLTDSEIRALFATCDDSEAGSRDRAIIALMAFTGARTVEVYRADVGDLGTRGEHMILWVQGKGSDDKDARLTLPDFAESAMRRWLSIRGKHDGPLFTSLSNRTHGTRLSRSAIRRMIKGRYELAGIVGDDKTTHSLRHSAITSVLLAGGTMRDAQRLARHTNPATTERYSHDLDAEQAPVELMIDYGLED